MSQWQQQQSKPGGLFQVAMEVVRTTTRKYNRTLRKKVQGASEAPKQLGEAISGRDIAQRPRDNGSSAKV
jgi:hypothetical protein